MLTLTPPIDGVDITAKLGFAWNVTELSSSVNTDATGDPEMEWVSGSATDIALSLTAEAKVNLSEEDNITIKLGTVYDTTWGMIGYNDASAAADLVENATGATATVDAYGARTL